MTLPSDRQMIIQAQGLCKVVQSAASSLDILKDIDLSIASGESLAIVGRSGSGKSTLLGLLAGLDSPSSGSIKLRGCELGALDEDGRAALRKQHVGFVFQSFQLLDGLSALENVMLPLELNGVDDAAAKAREWLSLVGLGERLSHQPKQLSGGEQQRVAIARAFVSEPEVLFADEPTGNLDSATGAEIIELLFSLNQRQQTTLVLVTHDANLAQRCERQISLDAGRLQTC